MHMKPVVSFRVYSGRITTIVRKVMWDISSSGGWIKIEVSNYRYKSPIAMLINATPTPSP